MPVSILTKSLCSCGEARKARLAAQGSLEQTGQKRAAQFAMYVCAVVASLITSELDSWESFKAWCISTFSVLDHDRRVLTQLMSLRRTGTVAEYKHSHDVLATQVALQKAQRLLYWEQGLKPEIRTQCKFDPATHSPYADIAKAQSVAIAIDLHFTAIAGKKRLASSSSGPSSAAVSLTPRTKQAKQQHICSWEIKNGQFLCPNIMGILSKPYPEFLQRWHDACTLHGKGKLLPRDMMKKQISAGTCFFRGCNQPHMWHECDQIAKKVWADQHPVSKETHLQKSLSLADVCDENFHPHVAATSHSGYSKLAYAQHTPSTPDWLWSEHRRILPIVFAEIEALTGRTFTLDAAASDSGDNVHCTGFHSPSDSFMSQQRVGEL